MSRGGPTRRTITSGSSSAPTTTWPVDRVRLVGSAGRGTDIRPIHDVDVLAEFTNKANIFEKYRHDSHAFINRIRNALDPKTQLAQIGTRGQAVRLFSQDRLSGRRSRRRQGSPPCAGATPGGSRNHRRLAHREADRRMELMFEHDAWRNDREARRRATVEADYREELSRRVAEDRERQQKLAGAAEGWASFDVSGRPSMWARAGASAAAREAGRPFDERELRLRPGVGVLLDGGGAGSRGRRRWSRLETS